MNILNSEIHKKTKYPIKILQIGEGNFLRGFIDYFVSYLNQFNSFNSSVLVVQPRKNDKISSLKSQDGLYTLIMQGMENNLLKEDIKIIDSISNLINPYLDYELFLNYSHNEDIQFVFSNTTEAGLVLDKRDLDFTSTPNSYPGKLLAFLNERYEYFNHDFSKGLYILPCELIQHNGEKLKEILVSLSKLKGFHHEFIYWLTTANKFYNTLVDRIVPWFPSEEKDIIFNKLGYIDNHAVVSELYHSFIINGDPSIKEILPFENSNLNISLVKDILPYQERKIKILNGSHSAISPIAYMCNLETIKSAVADTDLRTFLNIFLDIEVIPTINLNKDDLISYKEEVLNRFDNPFIKHKLSSILLNSSSKFKSRIFPSVLSTYKATGLLPYFSLFTFSSLLELYSWKDSNNNPIILDDEDVNQFFKNLYSTKRSSEEIVKLSISKLQIEDSLNQMKGACDFIIESLENIRTFGVRFVLKSLIERNEKLFNNR